MGVPYGGPADPRRTQLVWTTLCRAPLAGRELDHVPRVAAALRAAHASGGAMGRGAAIGSLRLNV
jgi:hypothetical protein